MRILFKVLCATVVFTACSSKNENASSKGNTIKEEVISNTYEIATWKNFSNAAVTHSWDDNTPNQTKVALPLYDSFNLKATFFVTINFKPDWPVFKAAADNGHEIASHSISHPSFKELLTNQVETELKGSKETIEANVHQKVYTIAYPFCHTETFNLTPNYYIAARGCSGQIEPKTPSDFMNISSFGIGSESNYKTATDFNTLAAEAVEKKGWVTYLFHGIDGDGGYSPIASPELKNHLQFLNDNPKDYWVAPFVNVVKYIRERNGLKVEVLSTTEKELTLKVSDDLDNTIYNEPITLKKQIYSAWETVSVSQNNTKVTSSILTENTKKFVVFNVVPDAGEITITH